VITDLVDLGDVLHAAADGSFPVADGRWERASLWRRGLEAVVALTGHAFLAVGEDLSDIELEVLGVDGFGGAHHPRLAEAIRGSGWADALDVLLVRRADVAVPVGAGPELVERPDLAGHPRVANAQQVRTGVHVLGMPARRSRSLVTIAEGVGGLTEIGIQAVGDQPGRALLDAGLRWVAGEYGRHELLVAAVAPGNARSLRLFLSAGFVPVGSVQLFRPERHPWSADGQSRQ
jgi:hypothetical protein